MKRFGFTLAEVLIALVIVGILALILLGVIQNIQNQELKAAAKKGLSSVTQAYNLAVHDNGGGFGAYNSDLSACYVKFKALMSKMKVIKYCPYGGTSFGNCWAQNGVGRKGINVSNCSSWTNKSGNGQQGGNPSFITADGMYVMLYAFNDGTTGNDVIAIDVNGEKGPNDWGKDVFTFKILDTTISPFIHYGCMYSDTNNSIYGTPSANIEPFIN